MSFLKISSWNIYYRIQTLLVLTVLFILFFQFPKHTLANCFANLFLCPWIVFLSRRFAHLVLYSFIVVLCLLILVFVPLNRNENRTICANKGFFTIFASRFWANDPLDISIVYWGIVSNNCYSLPFDFQPIFFKKVIRNELIVEILSSTQYQVQKLETKLYAPFSLFKL